MNDYFIEKIKSEYDEDFLNRFGVIRKSSFRINFNAFNDADEGMKKVNTYLIDNNIKYINPSWSNFTYIIENTYENIIKESLLYKEGKIYFQNLSTIIPILSYDFKENTNILDMCSAPGGKATLLSSIMKNKINLTLVEFKKSRYEKLLYNIDLQKTKALTINQDARNLDKFLKFDGILLDAPCTGSGTIDKNIDASYITKELLDKVNKTQKLLLDKASEIVSNNGYIIYMTCSLYNDENEEIINEFLSSNKNFKLLDLSNFKEKIIKDKFIELYNYENTKYNEYKNLMIKILPNEYYEGFFFCILEKIKC